MIIAFHQPNFLPNPGFFYKMARADLFVVITNIQFNKGEGWQRRQKIITHDGEMWLTVPTLGSQNQKIKDVRINNAVDWRNQHAKALQHAYSKTNEKEFLRQLLSFYERPWERLVDINMALTLFLKEYLDIPKKLVLDEEVSGIKQELIINVCRKYGADVYLSGMGGKQYMTPQYYQDMEKHGIQCQFVERNVTRTYPYSTPHYILTQGREAVRDILGFPKPPVRLAGYQPQYFPRLHYFARILDSDVFTIADYVQFVKKHVFPDGKRRKSHQADTVIKTDQGTLDLSVPVKHKGLQPIDKTQISYETPWAADHLKSLAIHYGKSRNIDMVLPQLKELLGKRYGSLAELTTTTILWALTWILGYPDMMPSKITLESVNKLLGKPHPFRLRKIVLKSHTTVPPSGGERDATQNIIETCELFGATECYVGGTAMSAYIDPARFAQAGIKLIEQEWECQPYEQRFPKVGFIPNLSILDLLANEDTPRVQAVLATHSAT